MTNLYDRYVLPPLINYCCGMESLAELREALIPKARGRVLEIGFGSGLNLPFYSASQISKVIAVEPSEGMRRQAAENLARSPVPVEWLSIGAEELSLPAGSIDTVVLTFTLCTVPEWKKVLAHLHQALADDGQVLFLEHGLSDDGQVRKWQNRLTPVWKRLAGGCHLNRPIATALEAADFRITTVEKFYFEGAPKFAGFIYQGIAGKD